MGHFKNQEFLCGEKEYHSRVWTDAGRFLVFLFHRYDHTVNVSHFGSADDANVAFRYCV